MCVLYVVCVCVWRSSSPSAKVPSSQTPPHEPTYKLVHRELTAQELHSDLMQRKGGLAQQS